MTSRAGERLEKIEGITCINACPLHSKHRSSADSEKGIAICKPNTLWTLTQLRSYHDLAILWGGGGGERQAGTLCAARNCFGKLPQKESQS